MKYFNIVLDNEVIDNTDSYDSAQDLQREYRLTYNSYDVKIVPILE